ncbi:glutamine--fructose-6-phosphate transaminase (isomerizing) [Chloroflexota bacterium]
MCGIVGFVGKRDAAPILLRCLRKMEYRGYDSAGLASIANGHIMLGKDVGTLAKVEERQHLCTFSGTTGIGHVRWATHGQVTQENAHPHLDSKQRVAVVHNGIIENHEALRRRLAKKYRFASDTDSEVIPHLIREYLDKGLSLEQAVFRTTKELRGSYAILAISAEEPDKVAAARKDTPLMIGINTTGNFIASDALSFSEYTNHVVFLEDGEVACVTGIGFTIFDQDGGTVQREPTEVGWRWDEATKQGQDYYTYKEILEQPLALRFATMHDRNEITELALEILRARQVVLTGCGTSRHSALIGRYLFSKIGGKLSEVIMGSELHHFSESLDRSTLLIAVSQSGETADVLEGAKKAKQNGAKLLSLVNVMGSSLARLSDRVIYLNCGPEIGVAATKSFVNQLAIFYMLAFAMANRLRENVSALRAISYRIGSSLDQTDRNLARLAQRLVEKNQIYYIARGINFAVAIEGALKLKEVAYVHAEGMPAGELKHGTLALIEKGTPVVAISPEDQTYAEILSNVAEAKARGAFVIGVSNRKAKDFDRWIKIPKVDIAYYPLVSVIPLQLLAYHSAVARGLDPDRPRNLAKSVTVK